MEGDLLRISDIGYGHGACNAFEGDDICGATAEWIASEGARKGPNKDDDWEPFRFCKQHWVRAVRARAEVDQERAFVRDHGYPDGIGLASLVCHLGVCILQEQKNEEDTWTDYLRSQRRNATAWLKNWVLARNSELIIIREWVDEFERWVKDPAISSPLIDELLASYQPDTSQQFRTIRAGLKIGIPMLQAILRSCSEYP